jgi:hypothetical protein
MGDKCNERTGIGSIIVWEPSGGLRLLFPDSGSRIAGVNPTYSAIFTGYSPKPLRESYVYYLVEDVVWNFLDPGFDYAGD